MPLTSSHIESTIKQINGRIKGTEKFRRRERGDAVLQLRADSLSDSQPLASLRRRWQAQQNGANSYHAAPEGYNPGNAPLFDLSIFVDLLIAWAALQCGVCWQKVGKMVAIGLTPT